MSVSAGVPPISMSFASLPHAVRAPAGPSPGGARDPAIAADAGAEVRFRDPDPPAGPLPTFDITPLEKLQNPPPPLTAVRRGESQTGESDSPAADHPVAQGTTGKAPELYAARVDDSGPTRLNLRH